MEESDITPLLARIKKGQPGASEELIGRVYKELRRIAAARMRRELPGHTLQPTALVHEVYLRLVDSLGAGLKSRAEFFAAAVTLMRQILIDHARAKRAQKRGGEAVKITFDDAQISSSESAEELIAVDEGLQRLAAIAPRQAKIVELRFFGGLSIEEIADVLGIVTRTVDRDWRAARVWLRRELTRGHATSL
jgi:RNA polymerase sigma-70 factor (ECF subfamily)